MKLSFEILKYPKILIDSKFNCDLQIAVVVVGAHTRKIWLRLEIDVAVDNRCRVCSALKSERVFVGS